MENKSIQLQQMIATKFLVKVREAINETAIVAGGAPRDWSLGNEASDVDIFVQVPANEIETAPCIDGLQFEKAEGEYSYGYGNNSYGKTDEDQEVLARDFDTIIKYMRQGYEVRGSGMDADSKFVILYPMNSNNTYYGKSGENFAVYNAIIPGVDIKVQIIKTEMDVDKKVSEFTADISRMKMNTNSNIIQAPEATQAVADKVITFNSDTTEFYIDKISKKFPDYKIVRPDVLTGRAAY